MPEAFPQIQLRMDKPGDQDFNPSIRLFGRRFFADQTVPELLIEFLLVATSAKKIGSVTMNPDWPLPSMEQLAGWSSEILHYAPRARLNLKLFAFLGASKLDTRHEVHRQQYRDLTRAICAPDKLSVSGGLQSDEVLKTLENLFLGFQSIGGQRTWCAQAFLPISKSLIAAETLWNETDARRTPVADWYSAVERFTHYFSFSRHRFLARGGELLYLQVCNALRQEATKIRDWTKTAEVSPSESELNPAELHSALGKALASLMEACPQAVGKLAEFIEMGDDGKTARLTDQVTDQEPRFSECGWCPQESWPEGILFAIEFLRVCNAVVDPIERLEMLELACAMQVLRSLCAQSARYSPPGANQAGGANGLGFVWAMSDPSGSRPIIKQISRRNLNAVHRMIHQAVRHPDILSTFTNNTKEQTSKAYKEADQRYGHKLFLTLAKRIGLVVPKRGAGARFVLNERLLRFLVLAIVPPGKNITYESFKKLMFAHYGLAVDDELLGAACEWSGTTRLTTLGGDADTWLTEMLEAAGMLIRLSDSWSLVSNPFNGKEGVQ